MIRPDKYSISEGILYHTCENKNFGNGIPTMPIIVSFSDEFRKDLKICPFCYETLDWNNIQ
jgi:hypothetical protein